jgi:hypothetical protein
MQELIKTIQKAIDCGLLDEIPPGLVKLSTAKQTVRVGKTYAVSERTITVPDLDAIKQFLARESYTNRMEFLEV